MVLYTGKNIQIHANENIFHGLFNFYCGWASLFLFQNEKGKNDKVKYGLGDRRWNWMRGRELFQRRMEKENTKKREKNKKKRNDKLFQF